MLTVHIPGAFSSCQAHAETNMLQEASCSKLFYIVNPRGSFKVMCLKGWSKNLNNPLKLQYLSRQITSKRWLCRSQDSISPENEHRSSHNIAISLFRRYRNFVERGGVDNLKEFISAGVNAYELGCTDEGLREELTDMKESGIEIEAMQTYGGNTGLRSKIFSQEVDECIKWLSIIFITILCTPQPTIVRWSSSPPVSEEMLIHWNGFCAIIANAYYLRGMAWLPVKTLQMEQMAVMGRAEEPTLVASRMRLVFSTLEFLVFLPKLGGLAQKMVATRKHFVFPLVYLLLKLSLVLPVATATVERAFSAMKLVKSTPRNRMGDRLLNDCLTIYIERDVFHRITNEAIMQRFQNMKCRRGML